MERVATHPLDDYELVVRNPADYPRAEACARHRGPFSAYYQPGAFEFTGAARLTYRPGTKHDPIMTIAVDAQPDGSTVWIDSRPLVGYDRRDREYALEARPRDEMIADANWFATRGRRLE